MSAVFGTTFCLGCKVGKIEYIKSEVDAVIQSVENMTINMKDEQITTGADPSSSSSIPKNNTDDEFIVYLSNGKKIRTKCVILCPECLPYSWISDFINQWVVC